jgi:hypothetical protein
MKKSQNMPVWLNNWVLAQQFLTYFADAGEVHIKAEDLLLIG